MRKIKIRLVVISLIAIVLSLVMQETIAYYSSVGTSENIVTSGELKLKIHEKTDQGNDFPAEGVYVMPGDVVGKCVTIENVCGHPFYLRVRLVYGGSSDEVPPEDCFKLNINEKDWMAHDGWYYYNGILQPGEITPEVFSHVEIVGANVDNSFIGRTLSLTVDAQAVQSENNPVTGTDYFNVSGWPAE